MARDELEGLPAERRPANAGRMTMTGFCGHPSPGSHGYCDQKLVPRGKPCTCPCHDSKTPPSIEGFGSHLTGYAEAYTAPDVIVMVHEGTQDPVDLVAEQSKILDAVLASSAAGVLPAGEAATTQAVAAAVRATPHLSSRAEARMRREAEAAVKIVAQVPISKSLVNKTVARIAQRAGQAANALLPLRPDQVLVALPPRFYDDHVGRDLPAGREIKRANKLVYVALTNDERDELIADADYYIEMGKQGGWDFPEAKGLIVGARATLKALDKFPRAKQ